MSEKRRPLIGRVYALLGSAKGQRVSGQVVDTQDAGGNIAYGVRKSTGEDRPFIESEKMPRS
jgi:hypothetical protein